MTVYADHFINNMQTCFPVHNLLKEYGCYHSIFISTAQYYIIWWQEKLQTTYKKVNFKNVHIKTDPNEKVKVYVLFSKHLFIF